MASVNSAGEVTALTKGNAVITAEVNGESVTCTVTVKDESDAPDNGTDTPDNNSTTTKPNNSNKPSTGSVDVSKLTLESEYGTTIKPNDGTFDISLPVGLSCSFTVKGTDMTAAWSSADSSIATVSADGTVKAVGEGSAVVTAKAGDLTASCSVAVKGTEQTDVPAKDLTLRSIFQDEGTSLDDFSITPGEEVKMVVDGTESVVTWKIGDTSVATISADGVVTGVSNDASKVTTITATVDGQTLTCNVRGGDTN